MAITRLIVMSVLHFIAMYFLMFAMVNRIDNIWLNLNNVYMAALMTTPMLLIEGVVMRSMYASKSILNGLMVTSALIFIVVLYFIRQQTAIYDKELIRSMIPHHSGAILMCRESDLQDQELRELCDSIIESQESEINHMRTIFNRLQ